MHQGLHLHFCLYQNGLKGSFLAINHHQTFHIALSYILELSQLLVYNDYST